MAKSRRTPRIASAAAPASAFLADMRALATASNPDAGLLLACDRFLLLREESHALYRRQAKGYMQRIREMMPEENALEAEIAKTPARTAAGRCAKAEAALDMLGMTGSFAAIARSVLRDFMNSTASAREIA